MTANAKKNQILIFQDQKTLQSFFNKILRHVLIYFKFVY